MDSIPPGQALGPYRIIHQVGQGGMATVYKAYHAATDRYVAVKVLPRQFARSPEYIGRFKQEARTIAKLEHPHILPMYDYGEADGITYFVLRFLDSGTLKERITTGPLPLAEIDRLISQVADALGYAHDNGVIHRDIKPSNIMLDARGDAFLTDFGVAKLIESTAHLTTTGGIIGTPAYMSPEQVQSETLDPRSDIYSLGIVLYEMVTGRVPFEAETPLAVVLKHLNEPLPPPSSLKPDLSPAIERVILKALAKNRDDRFPSAADFLTAWRNALAESDTLRASAPAEVPVPPAPRPAGATAARPALSAVEGPAPSAARAAPRRHALGWIVGGALAFAVVAALLAVGGALVLRSLGPGVEPTRAAIVPAPPLAAPDDLLYEENFEVGDAPAWILEPGWEIVADGGGRALSGQGHAWARPGAGPWEDYVLRFRLKVGEGALRASIRVSGDARYFVALEGDHLALFKQTGAEAISEPLAEAAGLGANWHRIDLAAHGDTIDVIVDDSPRFSYDDPDPILHGGVAFESVGERPVLVDDVEVRRLAPGAEPIAPPAEQPSAWASWTAGNTIYSLVISGNRIFAGGDGGVTVWNRADGSIVERFTTQNGLPDPWVKAVLRDDEADALWVGTANGLALLERGEWTTFSYDQGLDSSTVAALAWWGRYLVAGTHYSGREGGGLNLFDGETWTPAPDFPSAHPDENPNALANFGNALLADESGALLVGMTLTLSARPDLHALPCLPA